MQNLTLTDFYNHSKFKNDVKEGEKQIEQTEKELSRMKKQESVLTVGDFVLSTGLANPVMGKGKIIDKWYNGKFLNFLVDWDYNTRKQAKNHYKTVMRLQDIKLERISEKNK